MVVDTHNNDDYFLYTISGTTNGPGLCHIHFLARLDIFVLVL